jgi:hypothetical protein
MTLRDRDDNWVMLPDLGGALRRARRHRYAEGFQSQKAAKASENKPLEGSCRR